MEKGKIVAVIICFLIGLGIMVQGEITDGQSLYVSPKAISDYKNEIESEKFSIEKINKLTDETKENLTIYLDTLNNDDQGEKDAIAENVLKQRETLAMFTGTETVVGNGVVINVDDGTRKLLPGEDINNLLVHDSDLLEIVNELKGAGAEAISINGQRILNSSWISCSGYTIRIDDTVYARPFEIKAIGNAKRMTATLIGEEGTGTSLKNWGVQFKIETKEDIVIQGINTLNKPKYMSAVKEEE